MCSAQEESSSLLTPKKKKRDSAGIFSPGFTPPPKLLDHKDTPYKTVASGNDNS